MEMRKFIIEIHPDGTLTWCEYESPSDVAKTSYNRAWLEGYRQALIHCNEQVNDLKAVKDSCMSADLMYQGATKVRNFMENFYYKLHNKYIH